MLQNYSFSLQLSQHITKYNDKKFPFRPEVYALAESLFHNYKEGIIQAADLSLNQPPSEFFYYYAFIIDLMKRTQIAEVVLSKKFKLSDEDVAAVLDTKYMTNTEMFSDHLFSYINPSFSQNHPTHVNPQQFPRGLNIIAKAAYCTL